MLTSSAYRVEGIGVGVHAVYDEAERHPVVRGHVDGVAADRGRGHHAAELRELAGIQIGAPELRAA
ncbi:MAG TPA: hypothetical protein VG963_15365, partial [Polyangiaceae bacterium]|nr:hypothetical protein [Polyangiaceae bacterium]